MAKREKFRARVTDRKLVVFVALIAGFTILGPFGTYEYLSLWERLVFWTLIMTGVGAAMHVCITVALGSRLPGPAPWPLRVALGAAVAALPGVAVIVFFGAYFFPTGLDPSSYPAIWAQVAAIGTVAGLIEYRPARTDAPATAEPATTRLHRRLPDGEFHDIVSLTVRDHYVEVTTTTGRHMILMRLTDAIDELDGLPGERLHRSHWAAAAHLTQMVRRNQKVVAILSDGRELPVSKRYADAVEARLARIAP